MKRLACVFLAIFALFAMAVPAMAAATMEDGSYTIEVALSGGSGRATIQSPAKLEVQGDEKIATVVWSSSNYDRMTVDGVDYFPISLEGGATFRIPVVLDADMDIMAETVAMSTPHDIAYVLHFDSATLASAKQASGNLSSALLVVGAAALVFGIAGIVHSKRKKAV